MNPNQEEYSIDYLNQIAVQPKKPGLDKKFLILIGGGLLLAIALVIILISISGSGGASPSKLQAIFIRFSTLDTVARDAKKNIKSSTLRVTNANLMIFLTDANRDIVAPFTTAGITKDKIDPTIKAKYSGEKLKQTLEDARLNATFDRTYAREMSYELTTLQALMKEVYTATGSKSMKDFLVTTEDNLSTIRDQLAQFNDSTS